MAVSLIPTTQINGPKPLKAHFDQSNSKIEISSLTGQSEHSEKQTTFNKYSPFSQVPYGKKIFTGYSLCYTVLSFHLTIVRVHPGYRTAHI